MKVKKQLAFISALLILAGTVTIHAGAKSLHDFQMKDIDGNAISMNSYKGKIVLVVNVASKCGLTPQYKGLQAIYSKYKDKGFVVLGFPANNFGKQEPGSNSEIKAFCSANYGVQFPMFAKISVKGEDIHPLYRFLTEKENNPLHSGEIRWNFDKFLIGKDGTIIKRFHPKTKPEDDEITTAIEAVLK